MLASPVIWFPTNSSGRGKIWKTKLKETNVAPWKWKVASKGNLRAYFQDNTSVKILKLDCFDHLGSIQDNNCGEHLKDER